LSLFIAVSYSSSLIAPSCSFTVPIPPSSFFIVVAVVIHFIQRLLRPTEHSIIILPTFTASPSLRFLLWLLLLWLLLLLVAADVVLRV
jgi:hypothetical protein